VVSTLHLQYPQLMLSRIRSGRGVPSERAGGESRRIGNKRKAEDITRSAAEDFALLTSRTTSEHHAADFLSTVSNVIDFIPKLVYSFSVIT
jgi:hypothetical protein